MYRKHSRPQTQLKEKLGNIPIFWCTFVYIENKNIMKKISFVQNVFLLQSIEINLGSTGTTFTVVKPVITL